MSYMNPRDPIYFDEMVWKPGRGSDSVALRSLMSRFGKPSVPLGEAWFMGETRLLFDNLNALGFEGASESEVGRAVEELVSGLAYFPGVTAWPEWYGYLTPRILDSSRFVEAGLHGELCTGLLALSVCNPEEPAAHFEADFAAILSPWIMSAYFWEQGCYLPLQRDRGWKDRWGVFGIEDSISTSLLLTWRYLRPEGVRAWVHSIVSIADLRWRAHFLIWLMQVWPIFESGASNYPVLKAIKIEALWIRFYTLMISMDGHPERQQWNLIPSENIAAFWSALREELDQQTYFSWIDEFAEQPELWPQMEVWLEQVSSKYLAEA